MELSLYLAKVLGIFFLTVGLGILMNKKRYSEMMGEKLLKNSLMMFVLAMFMVLASLFLVVRHNIWEFSYVGLITFIGWATLLKHLTFILFPCVLEYFAKKKFSDTWIVLGGTFWVIVGLYLTYVGFFV